MKTALGAPMVKLPRRQVRPEPPSIARAFDHIRSASCRLAGECAKPFARRKSGQNGHHQHL